MDSIQVDKNGQCFVEHLRQEFLIVIEYYNIVWLILNVIINIMNYIKRYNKQHRNNKSMG